jgi:hypothetical protein
VYPVSGTDIGAGSAVVVDEFIGLGMAVAVAAVAVVAA